MDCDISVDVFPGFWDILKAVQNVAVNTLWPLVRAAVGDRLAT